MVVEQNILKVDGIYGLKQNQTKTLDSTKPNEQNAEDSPLGIMNQFIVGSFGLKRALLSKIGLQGIVPEKFVTPAIIIILLVVGFVLLKVLF